jgi:hypothetical protein
MLHMVILKECESDRGLFQGIVIASAWSDIQTTQIFTVVGSKVYLSFIRYMFSPLQFIVIECNIFLLSVV